MRGMFCQWLMKCYFSRHKHRVFFAWPVSSENCIRWMTKSMWCDMLSVKWSGSTWLYQSDIWTVVAFNCYSKLWEYLHPTLEDPAFLKSLPNPFDVTMNCLIRIRVLYCDSLFVPSILPNGVLLISHLGSDLLRVLKHLLPHVYMVWLRKVHARERQKT